MKLGVLGLEILHRQLLRLDPESAHDLAIRSLRIAQAATVPIQLLGLKYRVEDPILIQERAGLVFPNPVGLAAGFDKNGQVLEAMRALGFGFVETGTVTPMPQRGNPRPRMFRYRRERSLRNSLGFNNHGMMRLGRELAARKSFGIPVGVNIGKNRDTPAEETIDDYLKLVEHLTDRCDYFVVNLSSPNTPGLRDLQEKGRVEDLIARCGERTAKPIFLKLAPDLDDGDVVELGSAAVDAGAVGIILTNTTTDYSLIEGVPEVGGLSGRVLQQRSFEALQAAAGELFDRCVLISVGGIDSPAEAIKRLRAGASLVQIYTGMVFEGPGLISRVVRGIQNHLDEEGIADINALIGRDRKSKSPPGPSIH